MFLVPIMKVTYPKKILLEKGWTQKMIVEATGRGKSQISMVLNGCRFTPFIQEEIARVVRIPVEELFGEWTWFNLHKNETGLVKEIGEAFIQTAASVIICLSPDHQILEFNPEAERVYGVKRDEVLGKDYFDLFLPEEVRDVVAKDMKKVLAGEPTRGFENAVRLRDGRKRIFAWNVSCLLGAKKERIGVIAIGQDITATRQSWNGLAKREEKYRIFFESTAVAQFMCNFHGRILETNPAACSMYGYSRKEFKKLNVRELIHPDYYYLFETAAKRIAEGKTFLTESVDKRKDGSSFPVEILVAPVTYSGRKAIVAAIRDITNRKHAPKSVLSYGAKRQGSFKNGHKNTKQIKCK